MSKPVNKTLIGAFVVGALVLAVVGILVLGGGKIFKKVQKFVLYFDGSVKGLDIGAPVVYQGVKIGRVTEIFLVTSPVTLNFWIPVVIEINPKSIKVTSDRPSAEIAEEMVLLIKRGLRAKMDIQSPVTAKLIVQLGLYPDTPVNLIKTVKNKKNLPDLPQIPTLPSTFEKFFLALQELDLKKLAEKITAIVDGLDSLVGSPETQQVPLLLKQVLAGAGSLVSDVNDQVKPLAGDARGAIKDVRSLAVNASDKIDVLAEDLNNTLAYVNNLTKGLDDQANNLKPGVEKALESLQIVLKRLKGFVGDLNLIVDQDSITIYGLQTALEEVGDASRAVRFLADFLTRNPDALLRGRPQR